MIEDFNNYEVIEGDKTIIVMDGRSEAFKKGSETIRKLRELLWLRHGCPISSLYGDDGEMQCHSCRIDFKRDSPEKIEEIWQEEGRRLMKIELEKTEAMKGLPDPQDLQ